VNVALENRPGNKFAARAITEGLRLETDPDVTCT
jgi:hypothetical protein